MNVPIDTGNLSEDQIEQLLTGCLVAAQECRDGRSPSPHPEFSADQQRGYVFFRRMHMTPYETYLNDRIEAFERAIQWFKDHTASIECHERLSNLSQELSVLDYEYSATDRCPVSEEQAEESTFGSTGYV